MKSPRAVCERSNVVFDGRGQGWIHTSDRSTAARRRGRRALRFRLVQRKLAGRRVSSLCLRRKTAKTRRNLCKRKKAAPVPRFFCQRPPQLYARMPSGHLVYEPGRYRAALLRNRGASGYSSWGFGRTSKAAIGYRVVKRSETTAVERLEVAASPSWQSASSVGHGERLGTPPQHRTMPASEAKEHRRGACIRGKWGLAPLSRQDEDDDEQRGDRRDTPKNLHLITPVPRQPSSEELDPSCR